jgi:hypothetical protein
VGLELGEPLALAWRCKHILISPYATGRPIITIAVLRLGNAALIFSWWRAGAVVYGINGRTPSK